MGEKSYPGAGPSGMGDVPMADEPPSHAGFDAMEYDDDRLAMPTEAEYE